MFIVQEQYSIGSYIMNQNLGIYNDLLENFLGYFERIQKN